MDTREIAEAAGVSVDTVQRKIKELYPEIVEKRKRTNLDQTRAIAVMKELRKVNFVLPQNAEALPPSAAVVTHADLAVFAKALIGEMMREVLPLITQAARPALPEITQDYFTIKGYANKIGINVTYSEAIAIGRSAVKLSHEQGKEVRKADDERFGQVNSYHISVLKEVFQS